MCIYLPDWYFIFSIHFTQHFFSAYYVIGSSKKKKRKGNKCNFLKKFPIIWGHSGIYLGKKHVWPRAKWGMQRCCWSTKEGAILKTHPQASDNAACTGDSLMSYSFHWMAQTPDHKSFTSPTAETLPGPESLPHKGPHSSFLHSVTEMWWGSGQYWN